MRVVVTGATGNVGTSVVTALAGDAAVDSVLGVARRASRWRPEGVEWAAADVRSADLEQLFEGADAVIHLAWLIQPSRDEDELESVNVRGSERVFGAAAAAGVGALIYASSVGAYSPGPDDPVDESWPTDGIPSSFYSRHKAATERLLDRLEAERPQMRVVRLRPALIFKRTAGSEIARYFAGPLLPRRLVRPGAIPLSPGIPGLRFQAVHTDDVADAYRLAAIGDARGPFNVAAPPILDSNAIARLLQARPVRLPAGLVRAGAALTWRARLQPTPPGWVDMALATPLMDTSRIESELGWHPRLSSEEALNELLGGIREEAGMPTVPLRPGRGGIR